MSGNNRKAVVYDYRAAVRGQQIEYWNDQPTDKPGSLNSFVGPFDIQDLSKIPPQLIPYLTERLCLVADTRGRVTNSLTLDKVNDALNEVWDGPGSMAKVIIAAHEIRKARKFVESTE